MKTLTDIRKAYEAQPVEDDDWADEIDVLREIIDALFALAGEVQAMFATNVEALVMIQTAYGVGFTCAEAEEIHDAMEALDMNEAANQFMAAHATTDDEPTDQHLPVHDTDGLLIGWTYREQDECLTCDTCGRVGNSDDGIEAGGPCQEPCEGIVRRCNEREESDGVSTNR